MTPDMGSATPVRMWHQDVEAGDAGMEAPEVRGAVRQGRPRDSRLGSVTPEEVRAGEGQAKSSRVRGGPALRRHGALA